MHKSIPALFTAALFALTAATAAAAQGVSLSWIAHRDGYTLQWLQPDRSASLARPGLVIVVRPGAVMYEVNNRVEFTDQAPRYSNGDLYVSPTLAARLAHLATMTSNTAGQRTSVVGGAAPNEQQITGTISMNVQPQSGSQAISVSGHAPADAPVTITLLATVSSDIPTIVVSRQSVQPDSNGNFQAVITTAPDYLPGTLLRILATSVSGVTPASAQLTIGQPNGNVTVPLEQTPNRAR